MTPAHIPSLRWTLCSMLADTDYDEAAKDRPNVEARLGEAGWPEQVRRQLTALALRWVSTQRDDVRAAMRKALGEELNDVEAAMLSSQARLDSTREALTTTSLEGDGPMTIAELTEHHNGTVRPKDNAVTELYGEPDWSELERQARLMRTAPWDEPQERLDKAVTAIKAGRVSLGVPATSLAYVKSEDDKRTYTVRDTGCTCRATRPCYHLTAAELYRLWQDKISPPSLFPAPKTVDERLAEIPPESPRMASAPPDDPEHAPAPETPVEAPESPQAPLPLNAEQLKTYRQTIVRQLAVLGMKPEGKAAFEEAIMTQVGLVLAPDNFPLITERLSEIITQRTRLAPQPIPDEYLVDIKGKQHVLFAGLLAMAQARGLQELSAAFISVTADLALAEAHAFFADGRKFWEAADATPANVGPQVKPHFARMALTRAKARCLRDALNINACSAEEVE